MMARLAPSAYQIGRFESCRAGIWPPCEFFSSNVCSLQPFDNAPGCLELVVDSWKGCGHARSSRYSLRRKQDYTSGRRARDGVRVGICDQPIKSPSYLSARFLQLAECGANEYLTSTAAPATARGPRLPLYDHGGL